MAERGDAADRTAIRALGGAFGQAVGRLDQATDDFARQTFEVYDGFGLLGACDGALKKYHALLAATTDSLRCLQDSLTAMAAGLERQADALDGAAEGGAKQDATAGARSR